MKKTNEVRVEGHEQILSASIAVAMMVNFICILVHLIFCVLFKRADISFMYLYNIFSTVLFCVFQILMFCFHKHKSREKIFIKFERIAIIEILFHQTLAFFVAGREGYFQFLLLSYSLMPIIGFNNKKNKNFFIAKASFSICAFIIIQFFGDNYTPLYSINTHGFQMVCMTTFVTACVIETVIYIVMNEILNNVNNELQRTVDKFIDMQQQVVFAMANIIESRDDSTGKHVKRTSSYVSLILHEIIKNPYYREELDDKTISYIEKAAPLHDIGKIKIQDAILQKPGKLTSEEYDLIKLHSQMGAELIEKNMSDIEDANYIRIASNVARYHHERWDGKGYPEGLSGEDIPLEARVMAIADVYDALVNERCYKEPFSKEEALRIIKDGKGTQFDPTLVDVFVRMAANTENMTDMLRSGQ